MKSLSHIGILVRNLEAMERFYVEAFEMYVTWKKEGEKCYLTSGQNDILGLQKSRVQKTQSIHLDDIENSEATPAFFHFGFVLSSKSEFKNILQRLERMEIKTSKSKVSRDKSESFFCLDPEGNCIQVCYVPPTYFIPN